MLYSVTLVLTESFLSRQGFTMTEVEPMGIFQFAPHSRNIVVSEETRTVRLHVERLFGFRGDLIQVSYQTTAGSARALEDFQPVPNGELLFQQFQTEAEFEVVILNDQLVETEEVFYINLTAVEVGGLQKFGALWGPRLHPYLHVAVITILDDDDDDLAGTAVSFPMTSVTMIVDTGLTSVQVDSTTHPHTNEMTTLPLITETLTAVTETTGAPAIPEQLISLDATPTASERPDVATMTADVANQGTFSLGPPIVYVEEEVKNGTWNSVEVLIRRTGGFAGNVSVTVRTLGGRRAEKEPNLLPPHNLSLISHLMWAVEEEDFTEQTLVLAFLEGEWEHQVSIPIVDDDEPEGQEFFFVLLTDPQGGAQIVKGKDDAGFAEFAVIIIAGVFVVMVMTESFCFLKCLFER